MEEDDGGAILYMTVRVVPAVCVTGLVCWTFTPVWTAYYWLTGSDT